MHETITAFRTALAEVFTTLPPNLQEAVDLSLNTIVFFYLANDEARIRYEFRVIQRCVKQAGLELPI